MDLMSRYIILWCLCTGLCFTELLPLASYLPSGIDLLIQSFITYKHVFQSVHISLFAVTWYTDSVTRDVSEWYVGHIVGWLNVSMGCSSCWCGISVLLKVSPVRPVSSPHTLTKIFSHVLLRQVKPDFNPDQSYQICAHWICPGFLPTGN